MDQGYDYNHNVPPLLAVVELFLPEILKWNTVIAEPHKWSVCYAFQLWSENILGEYILGNVIPTQYEIPATKLQ